MLPPKKPQKGEHLQMVQGLGFRVWSNFPTETLNYKHSPKPWVPSSAQASPPSASEVLLAARNALIGGPGGFLNFLYRGLSTIRPWMRLQGLQEGVL